MKGGASINQDGCARVVFRETEPSRAVAFECVLDLDDFGEVLGIEVLDFQGQIGVKPPSYDPSKGAPSWSYDEEIDAFYVCFIERYSPRQEVREGSAFVDSEGSVVRLEAKMPGPDTRAPTAVERSVILALLEEEFPGRQALLEQVSSLSVAPLDAEGSLRLEASGPLAAVKGRVPVEAMLDDVDGITIHISLHVIDGLLHELEVYKDNLKVPQRQLSPEDFRLIVF